MTTDITSRVVIYHDETKDAGGGLYKGHVLLFVPSRIAGVYTTPMFGPCPIERFPQAELYQRMLESRQRHGLVDKKLHFSEIGGRRWTRYDQGVRRIVEFGVDALRHKSPSEFPEALCCKVSIMFYPRSSDLSLYGGSDKQERVLRHDETVLRMLLKGAVHYLYADGNRVFVEKIISDGEPDHRKLNAERVIQQIELDGFVGRTSLREYVDFADDIEIVHLLSDHKLYEPGTAEHLYANMLQLADLLLGAVLRSCFASLTEWPRPPRAGTQCAKKDVIAYPVFEMLGKMARGKAFANSGHFRSFAITEVAFTDGAVSFRTVRPQETGGMEASSMAGLLSS